jgi:hypothetical protein
MNRQITDLVAEARERLTGEQSLDVSRKRVARAYEEGC